MARSILFRTPSRDGFAIQGFMDASGKVQADVVATYVKAESDTQAKRYTYECTFEGTTRKVTIGAHHAGYRAPSLLLAALGLSEVKATSPATATSAGDVDMAKLADMVAERMLAGMNQPKPTTTRGRRTAK